MSNALPVLISGAGPTGLMMACELARHGVSFRIIDKKLEPTLASNASWIQTRTLEILDHIGMAARFLSAGHPCHAINLYIHGKPLVKIPLTLIESTYPFILMLPQSETERLLTEQLNALGHTIERGCELKEIQSDGNKILSTITLADGKTTTVTSTWLMACDGANSIIRDQCKIFFPGEDLREQFIVADAQINSLISKNEMHVFFDEGTVFAASPLGANKYRITANLHLSQPRQTFYDHEVIELVQERGHGEYYVTDIAWVSPFWIHGKIAQQLRHGNVFLLGDAAHIHSPAGGQGMNTGMQDAYNLAWKLAQVYQGKANPALLDSYQAERYPIVNETVTQTDHFTKLALYDKSFLTTLRQFSKKIHLGDKALEKRIADLISQTSIQYRDSPLVQTSETTTALSPQPGQRAPDIAMNQTQHLYHYLRNTKYNILIFTGTAPTAITVEKITEFKTKVAHTYPDLIKIQVLTKVKLPEWDDLILDVEGIVHQHYQIEQPCFYLIRPDTYIGLYANHFDHTIIEHYMLHYLR